MNIANLNFENHEEQKPLCMIAQGLLPVSNCTKPRLMRELQQDLRDHAVILDCTKPRLMRELQLRKPWGVKNTRLYQTKTHEGTTT